MRLEDLFARFDWNGDGRLQPAELRAFVTAVLGKASDREHNYLQVREGVGADGCIKGRVDWWPPATLQGTCSRLGGCYGGRPGMCLVCSLVFGDVYVCGYSDGAGTSP